MSIEDFDGLGKRIEQDRARFDKAAKSVPPGLSREQLVPGAIVMAGPHKLVADRSWLEKIFEIVASNAATVAVKQVYPKPYHHRVMLFAVHEMDFYAAEHILGAILIEEASTTTGGD